MTVELIEAELLPLPVTPAVTDTASLGVPGAVTDEAADAVTVAVPLSVTEGEPDSLRVAQADVVAVGEYETAAVARVLTVSELVCTLLADTLFVGDAVSLMVTVVVRRATVWLT